MALDALLNSGLRRDGVAVSDALLNTEISKQVRNYLISCKVENKTKDTLLIYSRVLKYFVNYLAKHGQSGELAAIDANTIRGFILDTQERGTTGHTQNAYYRALRTFFNWLINEQVIDDKGNPFAHLKPPKLPRKVVRPFTIDDIQKLLALCAGNKFLDLRNRAIILTFLDTGLRLFELAALNIEDININNESIRVMGKGARERIVAIGLVTRKALYRYLLTREDKLPGLWVTEEHRPMTKYGIRTTIDRLSKRAGIIDAKHGPHSFRHSFGTIALRNKADIRAVQALLGHSTLSTTLRYVSTVASQDAIKSHKAFSPVDNLNIK